MAFIRMSDSDNMNQGYKLTIMIFTEGTILGPKNIWQLFNCSKYVPIKNAVDKIKKWRNQGAKIIYLTSRKNFKQVKYILNILEKNNLKGSMLYYRDGKEDYKDIVEKAIPDILVEDDCKSIGGKWQMAITYVREDLRSKIKSLVVREFRGIDHLPDDVGKLKEY